MKSSKKTSYLMEDRDGSLVDVPESRLEQWQAGQKRQTRPLSKAEQQLKDRIVQEIFGSRK